MLDLIQAQEALKNAPDARLVQEMQQPSGNLPAFLVLGEMQRRQKMRQEAQVQQAQQQAGSTVAQDLTQQTGLAALAQMQPQMQQPPMQQQMQQQQMAPQMQQRPAGLPAMMARGGAVRTDPNEALRAAADYVASISSSQSGFLQNPGFIDDIARQHGVNPDALRVRLGMSGGRQMPMEMYRGGAVYMSEGGPVSYRVGADVPTSVEDFLLPQTYNEAPPTIDLMGNTPVDPAQNTSLPRTDDRVLFGRPLVEYSQRELEELLHGRGTSPLSILRNMTAPASTRLPPDVREMIEGRVEELMRRGPNRSDDSRMAEIVARGIGSRRVVDQINERLRQRGEVTVQDPYFDPFTQSSRVSRVPEDGPTPPLPPPVPREADSMRDSEGNWIVPPVPPSGESADDPMRDSEGNWIVPPVPPSGAPRTAAAPSVASRTELNRGNQSRTTAPAAVSQDPPAQQQPTQQPAQPDRFEALLERMIASRGNPEARQAQQRDMALLQLGLGLMSSRRPDFGGALGEAGVPALASFAAAQRNAEREDRQSLEDQISLERYRNERDYRAEETRRREAADNRRFDLQEEDLRLRRQQAGREGANPLDRALRAYPTIFGHDYDPANPEHRRNLFSVLGRDPAFRSETQTDSAQQRALSNANLREQVAMELYQQNRRMPTGPEVDARIRQMFPESRTGGERPAPTQGSTPPPNGRIFPLFENRQ